MSNIVPTLGVVILNKGRVLLVRHQEAAGHITGVYGLPGGRVKNNETEEETAVRELREETGIEVSTSGLVALPTTYKATIQRKDGVGIFSFKVFYAAKFRGEIQETPETKPEWVRASDLSRYNLLPNVKEAIDEALRLNS